ncbi:MAG: hypothetical protein RLZZ584_4422 [Pseudomonadota bacterium]|jgi:hypothetical protein
MTKADDDEVNPLQWFLAELERRPGCAVTKDMVRALLRELVGERIFITQRDLKRPENLRLARALLDKGLPTSEVRRKLVILCGFGPRTSERLVVQALRQRAQELAIKRAGPLA